VAGNLSSLPSHAGLQDLAVRSFGDGYQPILFAAAAFATIAALSCWFLVRATDAAPVSREPGTAGAIALPVE
jgi:hypothetical protein